MADESALLKQRYEHSSTFLQGSTSGEPSTSERPYVTLTFAQTIDGYISGRKGRQLRLSGDESMAMTHYLRTLHDAILVGVGTLLNDDPRLSARLLPEVPPPSSQPRPIVLDSELRSPPTCRLLKNYQAGAGPQPLFLCRIGYKRSKERKSLEAAGAEIVEAPGMSWPSILSVLHSRGVKRLMVEGGAQVIESLFMACSYPSSSSSIPRAGDLIDQLIVTVSPNFAGSDSTGYRSPRWSDPVPGKTKKQASKEEEEETGAAFHVRKKDWFGDDAVWIWTRALEMSVAQQNLMCGKRSGIGLELQKRRQ